MALRIKEILQEQGKKNKWLAEQLEITEPGLWLIMNEKINVPLRRLEQIADILGVSVVELFTEFESAMGNAISEKVGLPLEKLEQVSQALGVSIADLLTELEESVSKTSNDFKCPHCGNTIKVIVSVK